MKPFVTAIVGLALLFVTSGCAPLDVAAPPVSTLHLSKSANVKQLTEGREIYASACTHCHGPARIDRRTDEKWSQKILPRMCPRAKLTPEQTAAVTAYVMNARKSLLATPAN